MFPPTPFDPISSFPRSPGIPEAFSGAVHSITGLGTEQLDRSLPPLPHFPLRNGIHQTCPGDLLLCAPDIQFSQSYFPSSIIGSSSPYVREAPKVISTGRLQSVAVSVTSEVPPPNSTTHRNTSVLSVSSTNTESIEHTGKPLTTLGDKKKKALPQFQGWNKEKKMLGRIFHLMEDLQEAVANEWADCDAIAEAFDEAKCAYKSICDAHKEVEKHTDNVSISLLKVDQLLKIYTAEALADCSNTRLQKATIALSQRQMHLHGVSQTVPTVDNYLLGVKPAEAFPTLVARGVSAVTGESERICSQVIEKLQILRTCQAKNVETMRYQQLSLVDVQRNVSVKKCEYKDSVGNLAKLSRTLSIKQQQREHFCGEGDFMQMDSESLREFCRQVNKTSRKIVTELALREIRAASMLLQTPAADCLAFLIRIRVLSVSKNDGTPTSLPVGTFYVTSVGIDSIFARSAAPKLKGGKDVFSLEIAP
ncbi:hypothetical protein IE077_002788 [Cardiosporidium cionae]|uniref:Uncharacterized protein n=1 Tax=Cardiosporidium cionae TaxID=476202 RepID=A0ABQ7JFE5_9APIC|nr:hypothetical protein IE077_002788 [Cardiosporidium cionae]|eukprot:KAF8822742.1 hypothetical protein IE077_002788 [Cardiosporidium cionae]